MQYEKESWHIGLDLWQATFAWKAQYEALMIKRGYEWFGEARSNLLQHIPPEGIAQSEIVAKSQLSKQAVQQFLDELENDGVIQRVPDPDDARRKRIVYSRLGKQVFKARNEIKDRLEKEYKELLGGHTFNSLRKTLRKIAEYKTPS